MARPTKHQDPRDQQAVYEALKAIGHGLIMARKQPHRASSSTPPTTTRRLEVMKARTA
ncbi:MAG TPA: hypothetical protein VN737_04290 [Bryobacteraceae bacterium]|nr:hypothetical protein [Bryobacteraceae bacterium]